MPRVAPCPFARRVRGNASLSGWSCSSSRQRRPWHCRCCRHRSRYRTLSSKLWRKFGPPAGSSNWTQVAMIVTVPGASGSRTHRRCVCRPRTSPLIKGASRWLDAARLAFSPATSRAWRRGHKRDETCPTSSFRATAIDLHTVTQAVDGVGVVVADLDFERVARILGMSCQALPTAELPSHRLSGYRFSARRGGRRRASS